MSGEEYKMEIGGRRKDEGRNFISFIKAQDVFLLPPLIVPPPYSFPLLILLAAFLLLLPYIYIV